MNVRALVGPFDIARWSIDHSAEHNSMGLEDLSHYGGGMSYFKSHCKKQNMNFVNPSDPKGPTVPVLGYFEAKFWNGSDYTNDKLYILSGSHIPRVGKQIIRKLDLSPKFTENINDTRSFPPLSKREK